MTASVPPWTDGGGADFSHDLFLGGYCARLIENGLHGVRDGTLREDASRIRKGSAAQAMAALRNITVFLFKRTGYDSAAAATGHYLCHPWETLEILSTPI
jgi:hypothetical protein